MKKQKVLMAVLAIAFVLGSVVPAAAQTAGAKLVIGNGTGGEITAMIISPAKENYPKNENRCAFQGLTVNDKEAFTVVIPENLRGMDTFDIEIVSKGKRYVTQMGVKIDFNRGAPTLELSRKGKESTRGLIGAAVGGAGGVAAVAVTATAFYTGTIGQAFYAAALAQALGVAGSIIGGGMFSGIGVVAAIPVALGVGGFLIGRALTPDGLDVQVIYN